MAQSNMYCLACGELARFTGSGADREPYATRWCVAHAEVACNPGDVVSQCVNDQCVACALDRVSVVLLATVRGGTFL
jgi:hypothetical protein